MSDLECTCCKKESPHGELIWSYWKFGTSAFCKECYLKRYLPFEIKRKIGLDMEIVERSDLDFLIDNYGGDWTDEADKRYKEIKERYEK